MKQWTYLLVMLFAICLVLPVSAQICRVGVIGGLNFADMEITFAQETGDDHDILSRTFFGAGGVFSIQLHRNISIQLEPMYMKEGGLYKEEGELELKTTSSVLALPLFLKVGVGDKIRPYVLAGPTISYILDSNMETEMAGLLLQGDLDNILHRTAFGVSFGAGLGVSLWKGTLFIEGRYQSGLTNINKGGTVNFYVGDLMIAGPETDPEDEIKTKGIRVMLGYTIPLGGKF